MLFYIVSLAFVVPKGRVAIDICDRHRLRLRLASLEESKHWRLSPWLIWDDEVHQLPEAVLKRICVGVLIGWTVQLEDCPVGSSPEQNAQDDESHESRKARNDGEEWLGDQRNDDRSESQEDNISNVHEV